VSFVRQRRQSAAELDNVTVSIAPFIEQPEIFNNLFNRRHDASYISLWTAKAKGPATARERKTACDLMFMRPGGRPGSLGVAAGELAHATLAPNRQESRCPAPGPPFHLRPTFREVW